MSSKIGRNDPCGCGSGTKYKECCGKPKGTVTMMRTKDLKAFELTPGLAKALYVSLDASYLEYWSAGYSGPGKEEIQRRIAAIPEGKRYLTRVLDSLDTAFADFDSETARLDLPHMQGRKPEAIKRYLEFRLKQLQLLVNAVDDYIEENHPVTGGHA